MNEKITVGSCFSGVGGLELGLEKTGGFKTKWQIEIDSTASNALKEHWPNADRFADIRDVSFPARVDLICGGFPCQDVSLAGARAGLDGKRSTLWGEMFRLVREVEPRWVVVENVRGLLSSDDGRFFGNILRDLASLRYDAEWGMFSACAVGAPHTRERVFVVAHAFGSRGKRRRIAECRIETAERKASANSPSRSIQGHFWQATHDPFLRVAYGIPKQLAMRCFGNAVVPQVAEKIGEMILNHERR